ncbi:MAG: sugar phosphate nucleotidyltransferase, partial [Promethearchaeia archaeon]
KVPKEDASSYGIVETDDNNIIQKLVEKPKEYISNLAIAGIYAFSNSAMNALFNNIETYLEQRTKDSEEIYITDSLQDLVDQGFRIAAVELKKGILDFGRPENLLNGNKYLLENLSAQNQDYDEMNITLERSKLKNPVHLGENVTIINSVVGPYVSIDKNTTIKNCILENCVIERNTYLKDIITENSIIGSNVQVEKISKSNLIIGDKSIY